VLDLSCNTADIVMKNAPMVSVRDCEMLDHVYAAFYLMLKQSEEATVRFVVFDLDGCVGSILNILGLRYCQFPDVEFEGKCGIVTASSLTLQISWKRRTNSLIDQLCSLKGPEKERSRI